MSLCTLPAPVSSSLLTISPATSVVLFVAGNHLSLCRKSGQQVWSTRLANKAPILAVSWSKNGELFAVLHEGNEVTMCSVHNGRPLDFPMDCRGAQSIAWADPEYAKVQNGDKKTLISILNRFGENNEALESAPFAAAGTVDGKLRVCLHGALDIGELQLKNQDGADNKLPVVFLQANESCGAYMCVQNGEGFSNLSLVRTEPEPIEKKNEQDEAEKEAKQKDDEQKDDEEMTDESSDEEIEGSWIEAILNILGLNPNDLDESSRLKVQRTALSIRLVSILEQGCAQFATSLEAMASLNSWFVGDMGLSGMEDLLVTALIYGTTSSESAAWIQDRHEQGFKIWYRGYTQHWETVKHTLTRQIIATVDQVIIAFGSAGISSPILSELHERALSTLKSVSEYHLSFERQAAFLEALFTEEIDRPIGVTELVSEDIDDVIQSLFDTSALGALDIKLATDLSDLYTKVREHLDTKLDFMRKSMFSRLKQAYSVYIPENVKAIRCLSNPEVPNYAVLLESNEVLVLDGETGNVLNRSEIGGELTVFSGDGANVVSVEGNELVNSLGQRAHLDIEPSALASRHDVATNKVITCVLSHDCQHFQFIEF